MVDESSTQLDVTILGREYRVACKPSEREELLRAVAHVDARMREIRDAGRVSGADRIAVMAALNIAHELLRAKHPRPATAAPAADEPAFDGGDPRGRIRRMQQTIDQALDHQDKLF